MAEGVEEAAVIVCFLSQRYQDSDNCKSAACSVVGRSLSHARFVNPPGKLELKFSKQSGIPLVPVMVQVTLLNLVCLTLIRWSTLADGTQRYGAGRLAADRVAGPGRRRCTVVIFLSSSSSNTLLLCGGLYG